MLTHTRAFRPSNNTEFTGASANPNGFFVTSATTGKLTCTLWRQDDAEWSVILQAGIEPASGFIPIAVKKIVAENAGDLENVIVVGI